jgi:hypothetical protein
LIGSLRYTISRAAYYFGMAKLSGKEIQKLARSIVAENPGGIRYSVLVDKISQQTPEITYAAPPTNVST